MAVLDSRYHHVNGLMRWQDRIVRLITYRSLDPMRNAGQSSQPQLRRANRGVAPLSLVSLSRS